MGLAAFKDLCLDATDAERMTAFWSAVLDLPASARSGERVMTDPKSGGAIWINAVPEPKTVKNRIHPDIHCASVDDVPRGRPSSNG